MVSSNSSTTDNTLSSAVKYSSDFSYTLVIESTMDCIDSLNKSKVHEFKPASPNEFKVAISS